MTKERAAKIILDLINAGEAEYRNFSDEEIIAFKKAYVALNPEPVTNADRIRAMTDEELTDLFISVGDGNTPEKMVFSARDMRYERKMWLDWLKEEVRWVY